MRSTIIRIISFLALRTRDGISPPRPSSSIWMTAAEIAWSRDTSPGPVIPTWCGACLSTTSPTPPSDSGTPSWRRSHSAIQTMREDSRWSQNGAGIELRSCCRITDVAPHPSSFPVRLEMDDLVEGLVEVTAKTNSAVIDEYVRRWLSSGDAGHIREQPVLLKPAPHLRMVTGREHHHVEATLGQCAQERFCAGSRRIPVIGVLPPRIRVEHTIQIDADDRLLWMIVLHLAGLPRHHNQTTISGPPEPRGYDYYRSPTGRRRSPAVLDSGSTRTARKQGARHISRRVRRACARDSRVPHGSHPFPDVQCRSADCPRCADSQRQCAARVWRCPTRTGSRRLPHAIAPGAHLIANHYR